MSANRTIQGTSAGLLFMWIWFSTLATAQDITSFTNGYLTFTNRNPALFYTIEFRPNLTGTQSWDGAYRGLQDIRSGDTLVTASVGLFYRVVGSETALHTRVLSPAHDAVTAGYYTATNLALVDPDLATDNIRAGVAIFGVAGKAEVVDTSSGDATAGDLMSGKKAWAGGMELTGTIETRTLSATSASAAAGYYAATNLAEVDSDLVAGNIRTGIGLFGVAGSVVEATGDALSGQVLSGVAFSRAGEADLTGTMPNIGQENFMPATTGQTIRAGYHDGTGSVAGDEDLVAGNIRAGVAIFGVAGKTEVVDTTSGDALADHVLAGKKAWVDGIEITGTIPTRTMSANTSTVSQGYYSATSLEAVDADMTAENIK